MSWRKLAARSLASAKSSTYPTSPAVATETMRMNQTAHKTLCFITSPLRVQERFPSKWARRRSQRTYHASRVGHWLDGIKPERLGGGCRDGGRGRGKRV